MLWRSLQQDEVGREERANTPNTREALARAEGKSLNETVKVALIEAVERRRNDPEFKKTLKKIIDQDRELLERLAR
jgi:hypothetical protein